MLEPGEHGADEVVRLLGVRALLVGVRLHLPADLGREQPIVLRLLDRESVVFDFQTLGFTDEFLPKFIDVLERFEPGLPFGFDELLLDQLRTGSPPRAFRFDGYWLDIGRPDDYEIAIQEFLLHRAKFLPPMAD